MNHFPSEETMRRVLDNLRAFTTESCAVRTDEEIDLLGNIFVAHQLLARGILFETFLQYPEAIFKAATGRPLPIALDEEFLPLLPAQRAVAQRARLEMAERQSDKPTRAISRPVEAHDLAFLKRQAD